MEEVINMGKHEDIKRDKRLVIPVSEEERERIKAAAKCTVYKTAATMSREIILQITEVIENANVEEDLDFNILVD